ncbi:hypothetical protein HOY80DRAFT_1019525 [Tuber brumale]|nr:hypothetical protein HOY80DRAFT_1019525 [Tuber brumale]
MTPGEGISTTTVSQKTTNPLDGFSLGGLPVNISYEGVLEYGMVGLSALQRARNSRVPEMNIVSLCLSSEGINGSVAIDGFGEGVINHGHKAVFSKANVNSEGLMWPLPLSGTSEAGEESTTGGTRVALSYNSSRLRLPLDMPTPLLRLLGSLSYGKGMNGDTPALGPIIGGVALLALAIMAYIAIERRRARSGSPGSRVAALFGPSFQPSSFSPPMLYYEAGERPRTHSLATGTSPSDFKQEAGILIPVASLGQNIGNPPPKEGGEPCAAGSKGHIRQTSEASITQNKVDQPPKEGGDSCAAGCKGDIPQGVQASSTPEPRGVLARPKAMT